MSNRPGQLPSSSRNPRRTPGEPLLQRLRRDGVFFGLCIGLLAFTTWSLAVSWWLFRDPVLLVLTLVSIGPAVYLFYLRDQPVI